MPDDRTIGELARQIDGMRREQAVQMRGLQDQMRSLVSIEYLNLLEGRLQDRMTDIAKDVAEEKAERKAEVNRLGSFLRYLVGTFIAAAAVIIPLLLDLRGQP